MRIRLLAAMCAAALLAAPLVVRAEAPEIKIAGGFGITNLPLMVMERQKLVEKHAKARKIDVRANFATVAGGANMNDALLAGAIDLTYVGPNPTLNGYTRSKGRLPRMPARSVC